MDEGASGNASGRTSAMQTPDAARAGIAGLRPPWARVTVLALGLLALDLWCDVMGHSLGMAPTSDLVAQAVTNSRVLWSLSFLICCSLMTAFPTAMERVERTGDMIACATACAGTILYAAAPGLGSAAAGVAAPLVVVNGICYGWVEVRLLAECARLCRFADAVVAIAASQAVKVPLTTGIGSLPVEAQVVVDALIPVVFCAALIFLRRSRTGIVAAVEPARLTLPKPDQTTILTLLVLLPVMNSVARAISNLSFWGTANVIDGGAWLVSALSAVLFCVLVAATFAFCTNESIVARLFLSLVVLLGCLTLFDETTMAAAGVAWPWADSFVAATELYSHFLFWFVAVVAIRTVDQHPYRLAALTELSMSTVAFVFGLTLQGFSGAGRFFVNGALYVVVIIALGLLWRLRELVVETPRSQDVGAACARIAAERGLSPRETQVFELLAQGRSRVFIQEALALSDSTVKAHTSHVYQKLGVRSKQELISLVHGA